MLSACAPADKPSVRKKTEISEMFETEVASPVDRDIVKQLQVNTIHKRCRNARKESWKAVKRYPHLRPIADKLHLSGGAVDLLFGTDFVDAFRDILTVSGNLDNLLQRGTVLLLLFFGWYNFCKVN